MRADENRAGPQRASTGFVEQLRRRRMGLAYRIDPFLLRNLGVSWFTSLVCRQAHMPYISSLLLRTVDPRNGRVRDRPLAFGHLDGKFVVVASNGGAAKDPHWARVLRVNPQATVWARRKQLPVRASELQGAERERAWALMTQLHPMFLRYQERADPHGRVIPLFGLSPQSRRGAPPPFED